MSFLTFTLNVTGGPISLADLGNRTFSNGSYDLSDEFQIEEIRYSKSLAAEIFAGNANAVDSLGRAITAQASLSLTELLLNRASHAFDSDDLLEGATNKYYDNTLVGNFITVGAGSAPYLDFNPSTGELNISALAITSVNVDATYLSIAEFVAGEYTTGSYQESDTIILTAATGGTQTWINNGLGTLTVSDWTQIQAPNLTDAYIRGLFSANVSSPLTYNNITGEFNSLYDGLTLLVNTAGELFVDPTALGFTSSNGLTTTGLNTKIGGSLIENTTITGGGAYSLSLGTTGSRLTTADIYAATSATITTTNGTGNNVLSSTTSSILLSFNDGSNPVNAITLNADIATFTKGIRVGNLTDTTAGNIRFNGTNFQGYKSGLWYNLDETGSGSLIEGQAINIATDSSLNVIFDGVTIGLKEGNALYVPNSGIDTLQLAPDSVDDTKIDWGTGANQVNAEDLPLTTHTWLNIATPTDTQLALEYLDAAITSTSFTEGDGISISTGNVISSKKSWSWGSASSAGNNTNRYLDKYDGVSTNQSPFVAWFACTLKAISLSSNAAGTWTAEVHVNGSPVGTLASGGNQYAQTSGLNIAIAAGDRISFYLNGTSIDRPSIYALFEEA